jgi:hypothetical protein
MDSTILSPSSFCECFSFVAHHPNDTKFQVRKCPIYGAQWKLCNGQLIPQTQSFASPHLQRFPHFPYANNYLPWMVIFLGANFYYFRKQSARRTWNLCKIRVKCEISTKKIATFLKFKNCVEQNKYNSFIVLVKRMRREDYNTSGCNN